MPAEKRDHCLNGMPDGWGHLHDDGCTFPEGVGPDAFVTVSVSRELLAQLAAGWSAPVQIMAGPLPDGTWEMTARTVPGLDSEVVPTREEEVNIECPDCGDWCEVPGHRQPTVRQLLTSLADHTRKRHAPPSSVFSEVAASMSAPCTDLGNTPDPR